MAKKGTKRDIYIPGWLNNDTVCRMKPFPEDLTLFKLYRSICSLLQQYVRFQDFWNTYSGWLAERNLTIPGQVLRAIQQLYGFQFLPFDGYAKKIWTDKNGVRRAGKDLVFNQLKNPCVVCRVYMSGTATYRQRSNGEWWYNANSYPQMRLYPYPEIPGDEFDPLSGIEFLAGGTQAGLWDPASDSYFLGEVAGGVWSSQESVQDAWAGAVAAVQTQLGYQMAQARTRGG